MNKSLLAERERLLEFGMTHKKLYIYGAGTYGKRYFDFFNNNHIDIFAFIVTKRNIDAYCDKRVFSIDEVMDYLENGDGIIPGFENVDVLAMKQLFLEKVIDIYPVNHLLFLKLITSVKFEPILNALQFQYGKPGKKPLQSLNEILIIRTDAIGDLICTTPFIRELKKNYPNSNITMIIRKSNQLILKNCPYIDELWFYDSKMISGEIYEQCEMIDQVRMQVRKFSNKHFANRKFDAVFLPRELLAGRNILDDLLLALESGARYRFGHIVNTDIMKQYIYEVMKDMFTQISYTENAMHEVMYQLSILKGIGCTVDNIRMELWLSDEGKSYAVKQFELQGISTDDFVIAVGFVASVPTRTWKYENYRSLFKEAYGKYGDRVKFLILGGMDAAEELKKADIKGENVISFAGQTSLEETIAIIHRSNLYVGSNTGLLHMASACGVPSITIYAELDDGLDTDGDSPVKMGAWQTDNVALIPPSGLDGCHRICRMNRSHCINQITPESVLREMEQFLKKFDYIRRKFV